MHHGPHRDLHSDSAQSLAKGDLAGRDSTTADSRAGVSEFETGQKRSEGSILSRTAMEGVENLLDTGVNL
jgi:hypothetical protein